MNGAAAEAAATLRWPADAAERIDRLTSRWRAFVADGIDVFGRDMPAVVACRSSLGEAAVARVLRSPRIGHGVRTGDVSLWAPPILAEWAAENDARCEAWTALGDIWTGSERPPDAPALTCDGRIWRGARLACGIPLDQSLDVSLSCPAAGLRDPRRPTAGEEARTVALLDAAIALIDAACPEAGTAVRAATSNIVLRIDPQSPAPVRSASSAAALGRSVIVLNGAATPETLAEALVHEAGHTLLSCAELDAPMVADATAPMRMALSPWTGAALPAQAFLHACVIWSSLLAFWRRAAARGVATDHAQERIAWIARGFEGGRSTVNARRSRPWSAPAAARCSSKSQKGSSSIANLRAAPHEAISRLLAPMALDRFLQDHWQQRHVHIARGAGGLVGDLLSVGDLDRLFSGTAIPIAQVDMGQNAVGVQKADIDRGGYADAARMLAAHRSGNTIILRAAELWLPTLADLCAAASSFFHAEAQTNVYMTPAQTQSSYPHWDSHDLFIVQVAGRKTWLLHHADMTVPLPAYRFSPTLHAVGEQIGSFTLEAGDIAYLPRGLAHNPVADDYSVHISLGVLVKSWADLLLHAVSDAIRDDPALRGALPLATGGGSLDIDRIARQWPTIARRALLSAALDRPLETVEREIVASRRDCVSGQFAAFAAASDISLTSMVTVPARSAKLGDAQGGRMRATFDGVELSFDARCRDAIEYLLAQGRARVADIPAESDAHRIALAQRLAEEGCLAAVPIDAAA